MRFYISTKIQLSHVLRRRSTVIKNLFAPAKSLLTLYVMARARTLNEVTATIARVRATGSYMKVRTVLDRSS